MDALDDVLKIEKRLVQKATQNHVPLGAGFELLPLCNMNCEMCFIRLSRQEQQRQGRIRSAGEWLALAEQMSRAGTLFVLLTGGEPLLHPEFAEIYRGLRALGMIVTINTNGTLITPELADLLGADKPRRVNITLYGADNETYGRLCGNPHGFDQTMQGIRLLRERGVDVKLNGSLVPENREQLPRLLEIARELGLYLEVDTYMFPLCHRSREGYDPSTRLTAREAACCDLEIRRREYGPEKFEGYRQYVRAHIGIPEHPDCALSCRAARSSFWVRWDGKMTPCVFLAEPAVDVFETGFAAAWERLVKQTPACVHLPQACGRCQYRKICMVCAARVWSETGTFDEKPRYLCDYTRTLVEELEERK